MIAAAWRRVCELAGDPVLRRWLMDRIAGRTAPPDIARRDPPYLDDAAPGAPPEPERFAAFAPGAPTSPIELPLAGETVTVAPGGEAALFGRRFAELETLLSLHRFAWLPLLGEEADPAWVRALWRAWVAAHGTPGPGWAWHPYTAAERAINVVAFARRRGLPGPEAETRAALAAHAPAIRAALEYFGETYTSNHLSNDGRGLYLLGLALGDARAADAGGRILVEEAARIFRPSGVLCEGSSHYHLLLTRNYASAWLAARARGQPETPALEDIVRRALAASRALALPGGMPLVGDISPDCPPEFLAGLLPGGDLAAGWTGLLPFGDRTVLAALRESAAPPDRAALAGDGWARIDADGWSALAFAAPDGWPPMPGHGHQDMGSFELHHGDEAVIRDPGRGSYRDARDAGAVAQNGISVAGADPYPRNRAYYDAAFRRRVGGAPPEIALDATGFRIAFDGFARILGVGRTVREVKFAPGAVRIADTVDGTGAQHVVRRLHTTLPVRIEEHGAVIEGARARYRVRAEVAARLRPATCWTAYGRGVAATAIEFASHAALPFRGEIAIEAHDR